MSKSDTPPFRMIVEKGPRLAPATSGDAERLDTWRAGSQVNVTFVRDGSRPMERKWWAILGLVVDRCNVPWSAKEQASEAVKLSLGIVHYGKTVNGNFMQWPKSLTELSDPELDEAVRDMMYLLHRMTGVDPETLKKEAKVEDEHSSPAESPADEGSDTAASSPSSVAANPSSAQAETSEAGSDNMGETKKEPASADAGEWLKTFAKAIIGAIGPDETVVVNQSKGLFVEGLTDAVRAKARSVTNYARACCRGEIELADCRETIAGVVGCDEKELAS
ncbi:hypothetical protein NA8A_18297 [Nitratireductor indicus C115]|uniref:Uncharacterized protein n=1 Tax=Nitratireductor indicus C115 TaxID=1231190 RepID=K2NSU1_9HYPH|nr:hypothetical protein [Nitratireductor indicus]EKF40869.1 hypothetical protein NA8A_18297 [Nitratireductor indicus C115]SFQ33404.1 hypothetical protein SAMN05216176_102633 [Nitratireductor indicus]